MLNFACYYIQKTIIRNNLENFSISPTHRGGFLVHLPLVMHIAVNLFRPDPSIE